MNRKEFIKYYIESGLSYTQVGKLLGVTKQRVFQIYQMENKPDIKNRVGHKCKICKTEDKELITYQIEKKNKNPSNIIIICEKCLSKLKEDINNLK